MNDKLEQKIKNINDLELPEGLHGKIIRSVMLRRYRWPLLVAFAVVSFNIAISAWRVNAIVAENGALAAFGSFFKGFDASYNFVYDFLGIARDYLPLPSLSIFLANILLLGYMIKLYFDTIKYDGYVKRSNRII